MNNHTDKYDVFMKMLEIIEQEQSVHLTTLPNDQRLKAKIVIEKLNFFQEQTIFENIEGDIHMGNKIEISNSTIGILNSGEMKNIENISVSITSLEASGNSEIAKAIKELTEVVSNSSDVSENQRNEILEQIQEISRQATLPPEKRSASGVIKAILTSLGSTISTIASIAQIWSTWGFVISKFFGF